MGNILQPFSHHGSRASPNVCGLKRGVELASVANFHSSISEKSLLDFPKGFKLGGKKVRHRIASLKHVSIWWGLSVYVINPREPKRTSKEASGRRSTINETKLCPPQTITIFIVCTVEPRNPKKSSFYSPGPHSIHTYNYQDLFNDAHLLVFCACHLFTASGSEVFSRPTGAPKGASNRGND